MRTIVNVETGETTVDNDFQMPTELKMLMDGVAPVVGAGEELALPAEDQEYLRSIGVLK